MEKTYKVEFNVRGFTPGQDISEKEFQEAVSEFISMQNKFAESTNQILDKANDLWLRYENIQKMDNMGGQCMSTFMARIEMGIDETTTYYDWLERWYNAVLEVVNHMGQLAGFKTEGYIFRDGELPVFGSRFRKKPEWKIDLLLKPAEE